MNEALRKYHRDWYHANKATIRPKKSARAKWHRKLTRRICDEIKMFFGCKICGYRQHPKALEFHHRNPAEKLFNIACAVTGLGLPRIFAEMDKCDILCANCHAIITDENLGIF